MTVPTLHIFSSSNQSPCLKIFFMIFPDLKQILASRRSHSRSSVTAFLNFTRTPFASWERGTKWRFSFDTGAPTRTTRPVLPSSALPTLRIKVLPTWRIMLPNLWMVSPFQINVWPTLRIWLPTSRIVMLTSWIMLPISRIVLPKTFSSAF